MRVLNVLALIFVVAGADHAAAKGLEQLSNGNPEAQGSDAASSEKGEKGDKKTEEKAEAPLEKGAMSKTIAGNLFLATTFGWVKASKSSGSWASSGMTDVTVGYKVMPINAAMNVSGTYRYAPMAVSGTEDKRSYRGIWEGHYVGGLLNFAVKDSLNAVGTAELGYVASHLTSIDGMGTDAKHEKGGVSVALGGGADFAVGEKNTASVGPRLRLGFGSFSTFQLAGGFNFLF